MSESVYKGHRVGRHQHRIPGKGGACRCGARGWACLRMKSVAVAVEGKVNVFGPTIRDWYVVPLSRKKAAA